MRPPLLLILASLPAILAVAACSKNGEGTSITVKDEGGNTIASANGDNGEVKLAVPGLDGKITLPKIKLDADNFDLNGVHLYPGSTINSFNIQAGKGEGDGGVRVAFTSPAEPATVRDWLGERLGKADFHLRPDGTGLLGTTDENKPFRLTLTPSGDHATQGVITLG